MMAQLSMPAAEPFIDRRTSDGIGLPPGVERRQFSNSHSELSPDARELATAIDEYKLQHRRRFITFEEMLYVIRSLGYRRD
jgi:hypothetical protein